MMEKGLYSYEVYRRIVLYICVVTFREIARIQYLFYFMHTEIFASNFAL